MEDKEKRAEGDFSPPIQYTIENKNGVYEYSKKFEINGIPPKIIVERVVPLPENKDNSLMGIVKLFLIKDTKINLSLFRDPYGGNGAKIELMNGQFLNSTDDLIFELTENSKIEVTLFFKLSELELQFESFELYLLNNTDLT